MTRKESGTLVAFGEALWDCLPSGLFLGGAPLNVAYHASQLGMKSYVATSVGRDFLGDQVVDRVRNSGVDTGLLDRHSFLQTGVSIADLDEGGNASYDIRMPVAWDAIQLDAEQRELVARSDVFVYGSLAARSKSNLELLETLLDSVEGLTICDVNLRAPYDDIDKALALAKRAGLVKLNEDELFALLKRDADASALEEASVEARSLIGCKQLCVTLGGDGALGCEGDRVFRVAAKPVEVADTIGAGDSFTAALAVSLRKGLGLEESIERAVTLGAFVASKNGAQPDYDPSKVFG